MKKRSSPLIFIVEDNISYNKFIELHLKSNGYNNIQTFISGEDCLKKVYLKPDIVIQDYKLQGISGLNVLQRVKKVYPFCEFIFLSGQDNVETAINTMKLGAYDYIVKNDTAMQRLLQKIENIIRIQNLKRRTKRYIWFAYIVLLILATILMVIFFSSDAFFF